MRSKKDSRKIGCIVLCMLLIFLAGCKRNNPYAPIGSQIWDEDMALEFGVLETEKLSVLSWNTGRLEYTTANTMAETENGYYLSYMGYLWYADKRNLSYWIPVCNKPTCEHWNIDDCNAKMMSETFVATDGRIYLEETTDSSLYESIAIGNILASIAPDGTDKKLAYVLKDALTMNAGSSGSVLLPDCWLYMLNELDQYGKMRIRMFCVTENGVTTMVDEVWDEGEPSYKSARDWYRLYGDRYFFYSALSSKELCRIEDGEIRKIELSLIPDDGGCINGSTLRSFKSNKGYYDINVVTREKTKIADAQLKDSHAAVLMSNCFVESTLFWDSIGKRSSDGAHAMVVFDGKTWCNVVLPDELLWADEHSYISVTGVSSDSIFFMLRNEKTYKSPYFLSSLYRISLDAEALTAEYCCDLRIG